MKCFLFICLSLSTCIGFAQSSSTYSNPFLSELQSAIARDKVNAAIADLDVHNFAKEQLRKLESNQRTVIVPNYTNTNPNVVQVNSYQTSNGTSVNTHIRTAPNGTVSDNYSTYPNHNPSTGIRGKLK